MKSGLEIIVQTKDLIRSLSFTWSVVEKRNVINALNNVKLTAIGSKLEIGATDIDLYLNQSLGAEVIKEGHTTVSTQTLSDIVKRINDAEIKLVQNQGSDKLEIIGKNCRFELLTLPADKFPQMEEVSSEKSVTLPCKEFSRMLEYTSFAMSQEETRYNLYGLYMHMKDGKFCNAATDGHRLSLAVFADQKGAKEDIGVIVPKKTVHEIHKIAKDSSNIESNIIITFAENRIKFELDNCQVVSKLIDQVFPDYSNFIPQDNESILEIDRKLLASAIDRVAAITVDKFRAIKLSIANNSINITASGEAKGAAAENLSFSDEDNEYCSFKGDDIAIGFNPRYLGEVLGAIKEDKVSLLLSDAQSPVLIKTAVDSGDSFVVMPVKV